uniref:Uncharacterized protein n=1 Tax=Rousettus aegyptiacus TaxID=9407 RepID=A0A7J8FJA7_ROUAE|nr:hypothetical protein HJG63_012045 [Rousettus aegyptiacus]
MQNLNLAQKPLKKRSGRPFVRQLDLCGEEPGQWGGRGRGWDVWGRPRTGGVAAGGPRWQWLRSERRHRRAHAADDAGAQALGGTLARLCRLLRPALLSPARPALWAACRPLSQQQRGVGWALPVRGCGRRTLAGGMFLPPLPAVLSPVPLASWSSSSTAPGPPGPLSLSLAAASARLRLPLTPLCSEPSPSLSG